MQKILLGICVLGIAVCAGCGGNSPNAGKVSGTVTLDGQPLADALVVFEPDEGRPSAAWTDESGYYRLEYTEGDYGAVVGTHQVKISTEKSGDPDAGTASAPEKLPAIYNTRTELTEEVTSGKQTIDFDLKSEGKIITDNDG